MRDSGKVLHLPQFGQKVAYADLGRIKRGLILVPDSTRQAVPREEYYTFGEPHLDDGDRVVLTWVGDAPLVLGKLSDS